jgi:phosphate acyltransferase
MRIVVDVMGGDHGCGIVIEGVKQALQSFPHISEILLVGSAPEIEGGLKRARCRDPRITVHHASEVITMEDKPLDAVRKKKDCSMVRAMELVRDGRADAVISRGNTGALVASATFKLRRLDPVDRPAIAAVMPSGKGEFVLIDAGANHECKPAHLVQFAVMGAIYSRELLGHDRPRIGILSNGTEETKGTELTREAARLCRLTQLNFIGYVEGHDIFADRVEVVVTDGFVGNILLKSVESVGKAIIGMLRRELTANPMRKMGAALAQGALRQIKKRMDPEAYGGAPLLGLNGIVIKAHGSARAKAILNAIRVAGETIQHKINESIVREVGQANQRVEADKTAVQAPANAVA